MCSNFFDAFKLKDIIAIKNDYCVLRANNRERKKLV